MLRTSQDSDTSSIPIARSRNRKIHVYSAAPTHQPSIDLCPESRGFAPILRPSFKHRRHSMSTQTHDAVTQPFTENSGGSSDARARRLANLKPFKPGQSGNPNGRPKSIFSRAARKHVRQQIAEGVPQLDAVIDAQVQQAFEKRCTQAATFLRDCADGNGSSHFRLHNCPSLKDSLGQIVTERCKHHVVHSPWSNLRRRRRGIVVSRPPELLEVRVLHDPPQASLPLPVQI